MSFLDYYGKSAEMPRGQNSAGIWDGMLGRKSCVPDLESFLGFRMSFQSVKLYTCDLGRTSQGLQKWPRASIEEMVHLGGGSVPGMVAAPQALDRRGSARLSLEDEWRAGKGVKREAHGDSSEADSGGASGEDW